MNKVEILESLQKTQVALTEIVNNSNVGIKKITTLIKIKRDLQKVIDLLEIISISNDTMQSIDFTIENENN